MNSRVLHRVQSIMAISTKEELRQDGELKYGQTAVNTKENGTMEEPMERDSSGMLMEIFTRVNGSMTKPTEKAHISMLMGQNILESGVTINKMAMEWRLGQMELNMKEIMSTVRSMDAEPSSGQTLQCSLENS